MTYRTSFKDDATTVASLLTRGRLAASVVARAVLGLPLAFFKSIHAALVSVGVEPRVGGGEATKEIDQSLQREAATGCPFVPASSLKGALRARARAQQAADEAVVEARRGQFPFASHAGVVRQVPVLLHRHGLGVTLAFLAMRAGSNRNSPFETVRRQVDRWLLGRMGLSGLGALAALCGRDSKLYLEAASQAVLFARALCERVEREQ
jgi:hypothetical protein